MIFIKIYIELFKNLKVEACWFYILMALNIV